MWQSNRFNVSSCYCKCPPILWGIGIWEVQLDRGSLRCVGFYQGVDSQKNLQTPVATVECVLVLYGIRTLWTGSNIEIKKCSAQQEQIHWALHATSCALHLHVFSSPSFFRYTWVLISALRNFVVALFSFYCGGDKLHVPFATLLQEKFVEWKSCKRAKK